VELLVVEEAFTDEEEAFTDEEEAFTDEELVLFVLELWVLLKLDEAVD